MKEIVTKYLEGRASEAEQAELLAWMRVKKNRLEFNSYSLVWKKGLDEQQFLGNSEDLWNKIQTRLLQKSFNGWQKTKRTNQFFRVAAIFFFLLSLGGLAYFITNLETKSAEYYTNVLAENGHISKVELPDGSQVWLNSGSKITYSNSFASTNRNISLTGEAYFQIAKNEDHPLIVNSGELQVKVLGTKFNISAYAEIAQISVVLESGSIELMNSKVESFHFKLAPGERAVFNKTDRKMQVSNVNTSKFTSWKEGILNIYDQSLEEVVERLETRYNQKFILDDEVKKYRYTFTIKSESLDEIIQLMEKITPIKAEQKNDTISIKIDKNKKRRVDR
ncbi:FecR domain-containing protein [Draconibacterium sp.]|jgi:ferric-dicitrate binding protein FerR (iron transport regulator)